MKAAVSWVKCEVETESMIQREANEGVAAEDVSRRTAKWGL